MTIFYFIAVVLSLGLGYLGYYIAANLYFGIGVGVVFALVLIFGVLPLFSAFQSRQRKRHECYRFVHSFLISLSVSSSPEEAYDSAVLGAGGEEASFLASLEGIGIEEKLENLKSYFTEPYYPMFVSLFRLYEEVGGDVISLSEPLLAEATRKEGEGDALDQIRLRYVTQFVSLWLLSGAVLVSVRVGLTGFYAELASSTAYLLTAGLYFAIAAFSLVYFAAICSGEKWNLGGKKNHELAPQKTED
jgi:hypothetical protein